jgi:ring-1,2-phenylacetyl-CoA epoxidase subunit PaaD
MVSAASAVDRAAAWNIAAGVPDPELPLLTVGELGILRAVTVEDGVVVATITPTYSGCPALREIAQDVRRRLERAGYAPVTVRQQIAPPWTTEWITEAGRRKLTAAGIAPPQPVPAGPIRLNLGVRPEPVPCPQCGSRDTTRTAAFSGTACKALYRCDSCREPFEYVKPI